MGDKAQAGTIKLESSLSSQAGSASASSSSTRVPTNASSQEKLEIQVLAARIWVELDSVRSGRKGKYSLEEIMQTKVLKAEFNSVGRTPSPDTVLLAGRDVKLQSVLEAVNTNGIGPHIQMCAACCREDTAAAMGPCSECVHCYHPDCISPHCWFSWGKRWTCPECEMKKVLKLLSQLDHPNLFQNVIDALQFIRQPENMAITLNRTGMECAHKCLALLRTMPDRSPRTGAQLSSVLSSVLYQIFLTFDGEVSQLSAEKAGWTCYQYNGLQDATVVGFCTLVGRDLAAMEAMLRVIRHYALTNTPTVKPEWQSSTMQPILIVQFVRQVLLNVPKDSPEGQQLKDILKPMLLPEVLQLLLGEASHQRSPGSWMELATHVIESDPGTASQLLLSADWLRKAVAKLPDNMLILRISQEHPDQFSPETMEKSFALMDAMMRLDPDSAEALLDHCPELLQLWFMIMEEVESVLALGGAAKPGSTFLQRWTAEDSRKRQDKLKRFERTYKARKEKLQAAAHPQEQHDLAADKRDVDGASTKTLQKEVARVHAPIPKSCQGTSDVKGSLQGTLAGFLRSSIPLLRIAKVRKMFLDCWRPMAWLSDVPNLGQGARQELLKILYILLGDADCSGTSDLASLPEFKLSSDQKVLNMVAGSSVVWLKGFTWILENSTDREELTLVVVLLDAFVPHLPGTVESNVITALAKCASRLEPDLDIKKLSPEIISQSENGFTPRGNLTTFPITTSVLAAMADLAARIPKDMPAEEVEVLDRALLAVLLFTRESEHRVMQRVLPAVSRLAAVRGQPELSRQVAMEISKSCIWEIGLLIQEECQAGRIAADCEGEEGPGVQSVQHMWQWVSWVSQHKMSGPQLSALFGAMKGQKKDGQEGGTGVDTTSEGLQQRFISSHREELEVAALNTLSATTMHIHGPRVTLCKGGGSRNSVAGIIMTCLLAGSHQARAAACQLLQRWLDKDCYGVTTWQNQLMEVASTRGCFTAVAAVATHSTAGPSSEAWAWSINLMEYLFRLHERMTTITAHGSMIWEALADLAFWTQVTDTVCSGAVVHPDARLDQLMYYVYRYLFTGDWSERFMKSMGNQHPRIPQVRGILQRVFEREGYLQELQVLEATLMRCANDSAGDDEGDKTIDDVQPGGQQGGTETLPPAVDVAADKQQVDVPGQARVVDAVAAHEAAENGVCPVTAVNPTAASGAASGEDKATLACSQVVQLHDLLYDLLGTARRTDGAQASASGGHGELSGSTKATQPTLDVSGRREGSVPVRALDEAHLKLLLRPVFAAMGLPEDSGSREAADSIESRACGQCGLQSDELQACGGCRCMWYCSSECQSMHWKIHRGACKKKQTAAAPATAAAAVGDI